MRSVNDLFNESVRSSVGNSDRWTAVIDSGWAYQCTHRREDKRQPRTSDGTDLPESTRAHQTLLQNSECDARVYLNIFRDHWELFTSKIYLFPVTISFIKHALRQCCYYKSFAPEFIMAHNLKSYTECLCLKSPSYISKLNSDVPDQLKR